jgi:hypothetical protein
LKSLVPSAPLRGLLVFVAASYGSRFRNAFWRVMSEETLSSKTEIKEKVVSSLLRHLSAARGFMLQRSSGASDLLF